jgi:hypothetical protein
MGANFMKIGTGYLPGFPASKRLANGDLYVAPECQDMSWLQIN